MISERMQKELNTQINAEFYAAYLYLSMSAYFDAIDLPGFAGWMKVQSQEEVTHAMRIFSHVTERGGRVILTGLAAPPVEWTSPLNAFEGAFAHEQKVTGMINRLVDYAIEERDHATNSFLQWFVNEQVEEEATADAYVKKLKRAGESSNALLMIDRELAGRVFTMPADMSGE